MPPSFRQPSGIAVYGKRIFSCKDSSGQDRTRRTARVLIVDDNASLVTMVKRLVSKENREILTAGDGKEGLEMFRACRADLIISDFDMPGMNGLEMLTEIKKLDPGAKVIVMSGDASESDMMRLMLAGAVCVMRKPFEMPEMLAAVEKALSG